MKTQFAFALAAALSLTSTSALSASLLGSDDVVADFYTFPYGAGGVSDNERLLVNNAGAANPPDPSQFHGFVKFDLTDLPTTPVASAYFSLDKYCNPGFSCTDDSNSMEVSLVSITTDVAGQDHAALIANIATGTVVDTVAVGADGIYNWDVTSLVNEWIGGATNYGFALTANFDPISVVGAGDPILYNDYFVSSQGADGSISGGHSTFGPQINTSPVPLPAAVWMMAGAIAGVAGFARRRRG